MKREQEVTCAVTVMLLSREVIPSTGNYSRANIKKYRISVRHKETRARNAGGAFNTGALHRGPLQRWAPVWENSEL